MGIGSAASCLVFLGGLPVFRREKAAYRGPDLVMSREGLSNKSMS